MVRDTGETGAMSGCRLEKSRSVSKMLESQVPNDLVAIEMAPPGFGREQETGCRECLLLLLFLSTISGVDFIYGR